MDKKEPMSSLNLRLLGGAYLVYLASDLIKKSDGHPTPFFLIVSIVFALVGGILAVVSLRQMIVQGAFKRPIPKEQPKPEAEELPPADENNELP